MNIAQEFEITSGYSPGTIGRITELHSTYYLLTTSIIGGLDSILRQKLLMNFLSFSNDMTVVEMEFGLPL